MTDSASQGSLPKPTLATRLPGVALALLIGAVANVARLVPVVRGAGLRGTNSYDGAVYYAAAAGLAHGLLPYRDFLFLHPPGILVALLPFAALGRVIGYPYGIEAATLAWFGIGALNAVLVSRILRPLGVLAALVGGLFYAIFYPAVFIEHSTLLEAPAATATLVALRLLTRAPTAAPIAPRVVLLAGALLGVSASIKIWDVVVVVAVLGWTWITLGARRGLLLLAGAGVGATVVCLPFFAAAPESMWRMAVVDQLGRPRSRSGIGQRLTDMVGLTTLDAGLVAVALALAVAVAGCVLAVRSRQGRLAVVVLLTSSALLLSTPPWFVHYARSDRRPGCDHGRRRRRDAHRRRAVNWGSRTDHVHPHGRSCSGRNPHPERQLRSTLPCCYADRKEGGAARRLCHDRRSNELDPNRPAATQFPTWMQTRG
jgi:alpha-1,2-mannosyltransferase